MEVITITGYDDYNDNLTGRVYVLDEIPNVPKGKLYTLFKPEKELYKVAEQENSPIKLLSRDWSSGGSRKHPFQYCFSIYDLPITTILGWSFITWGSFRGKTFPKKKTEGVSPVSKLSLVPLEQRTHARFGVFLSKQEMPRFEDWWNAHIEKIFEEKQVVSIPIQEPTQVSSEDVRLKSVLEKID